MKTLKRDRLSDLEAIRAALRDDPYDVAALCAQAVTGLAVQSETDAEEAIQILEALYQSSPWAHYSRQLKMELAQPVRLEERFYLHLPGDGLTGVETDIIRHIYHELCDWLSIDPPFLLIYGTDETDTSPATIRLASDKAVDAALVVMPLTPPDCVAAEDYASSLAHELAHAFLPVTRNRFLDEGLATWGQAEISQRLSLAVSDQIAQWRTPVQLDEPAHLIGLLNKDYSQSLQLNVAISEDCVLDFSHYCAAARLAHAISAEPQDWPGLVMKLRGKPHDQLWSDWLEQVTGHRIANLEAQVFGTDGVLSVSTNQEPDVSFVEPAKAAMCQSLIDNCIAPLQDILPTLRAAYKQDLRNPFAVYYLVRILLNIAIYPEGRPMDARIIKSIFAETEELSARLLQLWGEEDGRVCIVRSMHASATMLTSRSPFQLAKLGRQARVQAELAISKLPEEPAAQLLIMHLLLNTPVIYGGSKSKARAILVSMSESRTAYSGLADILLERYFSIHPNSAFASEHHSQIRNSSNV